MNENKENRRQKWKKYRDSINGYSFFYFALLEKDVKLKKNYYKIKKIVENFNKKSTLKIDDFLILENLDREKKANSNLEDDKNISLNFNFLNNKINELNAFLNEKKERITFVENINIDSHIFDEEIQHVESINIENERIEMKKINIAIDGPSGVGKSSVSELLAKKYDLKFINSGSFYRAISLYFLNKLGENNFSQISNEKFVLENWNIDKLHLDQKGNLYLENKLINSNDLRQDVISWGASNIARYKEIRKQIVKFLQDYSSKEKGVIMDGRDTTFVILPNAELKIFLWASAEVRALRRMKQNKEMGFETDFEKLKKEIEDRDFQDMNRENDPLHKAEDAILIDSSKLTLEEVVEEISKLVEQRMKNE
ncbi:(d)CMP kinase [Mycoplasma sp. 480]|uniref:(d)CMP kinase n=1 Tax=Mycoplasma sp. 480 TaxID=3440155 RepID=UPI003F516B89